MLWLKKCIPLVIMSVLVISPSISYSQCNVEEVVFYVKKWVLPVPAANKQERKDMRQLIRSLCDGKTTAEGCSLKDVINYAEKGQNAQVIQEKCK